MTRRNLALAGFAGAGALATLHPLAGHTTECAQLSHLELAHTQITLAESLAAGAFKPPTGGAPGAPPVSYSNLPPFCRVAGTIRPTPDSDIRFEVWMPADNWNGDTDHPGVSLGEWDEREQVRPLLVHGNGPDRNSADEVLGHRGLASSGSQADAWYGHLYPVTNGFEDRERQVHPGRPEDLRRLADRCEVHWLSLLRNRLWIERLEHLLEALRLDGHLLPAAKL